MYGRVKWVSHDWMAVGALREFVAIRSIRVSEHVSRVGRRVTVGFRDGGIGEKKGSRMCAYTDAYVNVNEQMHILPACLCELCM